MGLKQRFMFVLAVTLACLLTVAHQQQQQNQAPPALPAATVIPVPAPTEADAGTPEELPDEEAVPEITIPGLKKPVWEKHFVVEMFYRGEITEDGAKVITSVVKQVNDSLHDPKQDPVEAMVLVLNTPGGNLTSGTTIVQQLQQLEVPLVCVADSRTFSMGFYILQAACSVRLVTDRGALMIHEPHEATKVTLNEPTRWDYENQAEQLRVASLGWLRVCAQRMNMDPSFLGLRVRNVDWYMTADEALGANAVDAIISNIERDVVKPLKERLELPPQLGVPAVLLRAPVSPLPEQPVRRHQQQRRE
jgi:ATP-dependent protease ClpP protease subunit